MPARSVIPIHNRLDGYRPRRFYSYGTYQVSDRIGSKNTVYMIMVDERGLPHVGDMVEIDGVEHRVRGLRHGSDPRVGVPVGVVV